MRKLILAFILGIGVFLNANVNADLVEPPKPGECKNLAGESIRYIPLPHKVFKKLFPEIWFATARKNVVLYDYQSLSRIPQAHQELVYWHECGHHALGHVPLSAYDSPAATLRDESEADCYAAGAVKEHRDFKPRDMKRATTSMFNIGMSPERVALTWACAISS